ncbi:MAG TPA: amino acid permease [Longilinea sp.]|nr:amino acid permease [Longilinea sp.]
MNIEEKNGSTVLRRATEYKPGHSISTWLIGRPLSTADAPHQTIGKFIGLAVFSSDAMSSVAYGPMELLIILAAAGMSALQYAIPLAIAIVVLLTILVISYEQTIHAYPGGGGAYIVARDNLGEIPALVAAASLLTDYILTVSVSVSSGVLQFVSAFPALYEYRVWISVVLVLFVMLVNLRGVKESGAAFAIPTYFFLVMMYITVAIGFVQLALGSLGIVSNPPMDIMGEIGTVQAISLFLLLKAFSSGTSAVTGVEAISNGITAFKEPRSKNAGKTLIWMGFILGSLMLGITILGHYVQAMPSEREALISQIARTIYGNQGIFYILTIISATVILIMAANTAFADFPRLSALVAADGFIPRQFTYRGSRLVYSRGIVALALVACGLIILFRASVTALIPLYAIGVFTSFTLSQFGMALRWWKCGHLKPGEEVKERGSTLQFDKGWIFKMVVNGIGSVMTFVVAIIFSITKFTSGAYIVLILIPILVVGFIGIHRHYRTLAKNLTLDNFTHNPAISRNRVIIPVSGVHRGTLAALRYAHTLSDDITAVHISIDPQESAKIQAKWETWGDGLRLVIIESPYRLFIEPLLEYISELDTLRKPNEMITVVVPQFIPKHNWSNLLHTRTADTLRKVLFNTKNIVIIEVPYQVD